jgi:cobyrinic acid a,c-diamide synthase
MLLAALAERGIAIQPFKVGPDFIDPAYHSRFAGVPSRNLDAWMMGAAGIQREVTTCGAGKLSIIEGVMGLFDGSEAISDAGSTMELARLLNWPVILVVPCAKSGRSLAAALRGFIEEAGSGRIAGVILNEVGGTSHADYLAQAIAPLNLRVLGAIPKCEELRWPERHLGLQASQERELPSRAELARLAAQHLDLEQMLSLVTPAPTPDVVQGSENRRIRIGVARDEAFHFYYQSNLDYLRNHGAELIEFSPVRDLTLPTEISGLIFGGGFPEVFAEALSQNQSMRREIRTAIADGLPCYAECGGLMMLAQELRTLGGIRYPMAGAVPGAVEMTRRLQHFGYCTCSDLAGADGATFRGHEFHYSQWLGEEQHANLWISQRNRMGSARKEGYTKHRLHASYVHLHFSSSELPVGPLLRNFNLETETV